jgi:hypothetical protein
MMMQPHNGSDDGFEVSGFGGGFHQHRGLGSSGWGWWDTWPYFEGPFWDWWDAWYPSSAGPWSWGPWWYYDGNMAPAYGYSPYLPWFYD